MTARMTSIYPRNTPFSCPLCQHSEKKILFIARDADRIQAEAFEVAQCSSCKLVLTHPFLQDNEMRQWYRTRYHGWWQNKKWHPFALITNMFQKRRLHWVKRFLGNKARLVDFGSGDGTFVKFMGRHGFEVVGIENLDFLQNFKMPNTRIHKKIFPIDTNRYYQEYLNSDIITFWQVLEHVADPLSVLRQANHLLKPTGILLISVPNFDSMQSALFRDKWFHLDIPRHRWHFCPKTITAFLNKSGFKVVKISHFSLEYSPFGWLQSLLNCFAYSHNFIYNLFKRNEWPRDNDSSLKRQYDLYGSMLLGAISLAVLPIVCITESFLKRGGVITVTARKTSEKTIDE